MAPVRHHSPRAVGGFTLIELMVTVVLFGVMVGLAAPAMAGMVNHYRLDRAVSQLSADVMYARMMAVRSGQRVEMVLNTGGYSIRRTDQAQPAKQVDLAAEHPGMQLSASVVLPATAVFDSRGLLTDASDGGTITLERAGLSKTMTVLATGRIYHAY